MALDLKRWRTERERLTFREGLCSSHPFAGRAHLFLCARVCVLRGVVGIVMILMICRSSAVLRYVLNEC